MPYSHRSTKKQRKYNQELTARRFASTVPAQTLSWLSSISLLSGGFVFAQTESPADNIVSTVEVSQPTTLGDRGQNGQGSLPLESKVTELKTGVQTQGKNSEVNSNLESVATERNSESKSESSPTSVILKVPAPPTLKSQPETLPTSTQPIPETSTLVIPVTSQPNNSDNGNTGKDYNSTQIDPTEYNGNSTVKYDAPSSVEVTGVTQDCKAVISPTGKSVGTCGGKNSTNPSVANFTQKSAPTWLKKSAPGNLGKSPLKTVPSETPLSTNNSNPRPQSEKSEEIVNSLAGTVNNSQNWHSLGSNSSSGHTSAGKQDYTGRISTKTSYNRPRIPDPREFSSGTTVTPVTPSFGTLPPPMIEGKVAPRPSKVAYDFDLASVLPQVPYISSFADNGTNSGVTFPLSFAAPITSLFGWRTHPITGDRRFHAGMDIAAPTGTPILAAEKGQVEAADWMGGYGLAVTINHNQRQQTLYGHMSEILVRPGQWVEPGMIIGRVGSTGNSTGPHLHFEVRHLTDNGWVAVDPSMQLQAGMNSLYNRVAYNYNPQSKQLR
ncbi:M23 family metallopeptidase [Cylindrospermopsis raciborskii]|uniref:Peptidase M23 n=1 Tax=Cylindrospermopsis raciborskii CENA302 TaxID=1170768 RepID=A0A9Q5QYG0_9CYAN|nr:M23 family metallopeptidase [Cylindrospermopsis raciborskii]OPH10487.1 peptidase M23 [Cylindrospermopsis raciborskii CENA302]